MLYIIFFFKQKTAYEMRISDWSSDVCSSDLLWQDGTGSAGKAVLPSGGCAFVIVEVRWQPSYCAAPMPRSCFLASRKSRASSPAPKGRPFLRCLPSCSHATPCLWFGGWLFEDASAASSMAGGTPFGTPLAQCPPTSWLLAPPAPPHSPTHSPL